jgi:hypothetical protein
LANRNLTSGNLANRNLADRNSANGNLADRNPANRNLTNGNFAGRNNLGRNNLASTNPTWRNGFDHANFHRLGEGGSFGRGRFGEGFGRFNQFANNNFVGAFGGGWVGLVFWPYAYSDIYCGAFWGECGYGAPFWDYGYDDIYGAMFWPYAYDLLVSYLPDLTGGYRYDNYGYGGYAGDSAGYTSAIVGHYTGARGRRHAARTYSRNDEVGTLPAPAQLAQMCGQDTQDVIGLPSDQIQELISPTPDQQAALDDFINASKKAAQIIKAACPATIPFTPTGRLETMGQRLAAMAQAVTVLQGPLDRFWGMLTDEQKLRLSTAGTAQDQQNAQQVRNGSRSVARGCSAATPATQWPSREIEKAIRPTADQEAKLDALKRASDQAAEQLAKACPTELPSTPSDRLAAIGKRVDVMEQAVNGVRMALADFYGSLSDEQKSEFNMIGGRHSARGQG